jgi:hypothetical protein
MGRECLKSNSRTRSAAVTASQPARAARAVGGVPRLPIRAAMQPRQSQPVTFTSRYTTLAMIHAGDAAARAEAHAGKAMETGTSELRPQLAALPRLGTPPMSGRQATPHRAAAKSLAHRQRVLGASQLTGSSSHSPTSREAKSLAHGQRALRNSPTQQGRPRDRWCETPPDSNHRRRDERLW